MKIEYILLIVVSLINVILITGILLVKKKDKEEKKKDNMYQIPMVYSDNNIHDKINATEVKPKNVQKREYTKPSKKRRRISDAALIAIIGNSFLLIFYSINLYNDRMKVYDNNTKKALYSMFAQSEKQYKKEKQEKKDKQDEAVKHVMNNSIESGKVYLNFSLAETDFNKLFNDLSQKNNLSNNVVFDKIQISSTSNNKIASIIVYMVEIQDGKDIKHRFILQGSGNGNYMLICGDNKTEVEKVNTYEEYMSFEEASSLLHNYMGILVNNETKKTITLCGHKYKSVEEIYNKENTDEQHFLVNFQSLTKEQLEENYCESGEFYALKIEEFHDNVKVSEKDVYKVH